MTPTNQQSEETIARLDISRRSVLKATAVGGLGLTGIIGLPAGTGRVRAQAQFDDLCAAVPHDVMLVIDRSGSMLFEPNKFQNAKDGAKAFVDELTTSDQAGLVSFNQTPSLDQALTSNLSDVQTAINGLSAGGGTDIGAAVNLAQAQFPGRPDADDIMVVLSNGNDLGGAAVSAAAAAKAAGTRVITIAYGTDSDTATLEEMASDPPEDNAFVAAIDTIESIFETIAQEICPLEVEINIKPGSDPNAVNCGKEGGTPVAVLTTSTFDATAVDPSSLRFGAPSEVVAGNGASIIHEGGHFEDAKADDGSKDGDTDFVGHFYTPDTGFTKSDTEGWLVGKTTDGKDIAGKDNVKIVGKCN